MYSATLENFPWISSPNMPLDYLIKMNAIFLTAVALVESSWYIIKTEFIYMGNECRGIVGIYLVGVINIYI